MCFFQVAVGGIRGGLKTYTAVRSVRVLALVVAHAGLCRCEESEEARGDGDEADHVSFFSFFSSGGMSAGFPKVGAVMLDAGYQRMDMAFAFITKSMDLFGLSNISWLSFFSGQHSEPLVVGSRQFLAVAACIYLIRAVLIACAFFFLLLDAAIPLPHAAILIPSH